MLQYLVDSYLGGYGLPQLRTVTGYHRLGVNEKGEHCLVNILDNKPIGWSLPNVVAIRLYHLSTGSLSYLLLSDMTERWMCGDGDLRERVSPETVQLYLESSE
jgi:hypothetical protein